MLPVTAAVEEKRVQSLTAQRRHGRIDRLDQYAIPVQLLACMGIQQDPGQLDNLGGGLCHVDAMLVARRGNVDDNVAVDGPVRAVDKGHSEGRQKRKRVKRTRGCEGE